MKTLKAFIDSEYKTFSVLFMLSAFSILLLMFRMKLTQSYVYLFLVWNLFLAGIPYMISLYLSTLKTPKKFYLLAIAFIWLLFLPNAPYIITDLYHLQNSIPLIIWLDTLVIATFVITGMLLFYKSVATMETIFKANFGKRCITYSLPFLFLSVGFGVYLGRFLRFNSWEILNKPLDILDTIFSIITQPNLYIDAWLFTIVFGLFLGVFYYGFKVFIGSKKAS